MAAISLMLGLSGACAIVVIGTLLAGRLAQLPALLAAKIPSSSISASPPMATTRTLLLHAGPIHDIGTISLWSRLSASSARWRFGGSRWRSMPTPVRASRRVLDRAEEPRATLQAAE